MKTERAFTALIAEDEPLLARGLTRTLTKLWPSLRIVSLVHDGLQAVEAALAGLPDVLFLDIKMPECSGLEVAHRVVDEWPASKPLPLLVFVTAFDRFAVDAFEKAAVDYVLKPVEAGRMQETCRRLQLRLAERDQAGDAILSALASLRMPTPPAEPLNLIQASVGNSVHFVPVDDVQYFEADDKYVQVVTPERVLLVRTPLRELIPRLDPRRFVQVHRSIVVRIALIDRAERLDNGRLVVHLRGSAKPLPISRSFSHAFRPM